MTQTARPVALIALRLAHQSAFADAALDQTLRQTSLSEPDRRLVTELVYGCMRRSRTLDALIDQLATKPAQQQPPNLRLILHLGLYQLRYLDHIPASAAVDTTVNLTKTNGFGGLSGFVNGLLRQYLRLRETADPLVLPDDPVERLAVQYSYPNWIVQVWLDALGFEETEHLCYWLNQSPYIDLRVNSRLASIEQVEAAMQTAGVAIARVPHLPQALRLTSNRGAVHLLPGYAEGLWSVQDASAQLVGYLLDPQPHEIVIDACAAPGGKTTHIAELMGDRGTVWAGDRSPNRLKKLQQNAQRLQLTSIQLCPGDSRTLDQFTHVADRVLLDAPCSGLGTLHRHADARWRQTPETVQELGQLQRELLDHTSTWVKPGGILVYATCTLHPAENEAIAQQFLATHPTWQIEPPEPNNPAAAFVTPDGWIKVLPHRQNMDGFFMVKLRRKD